MFALRSLTPLAPTAAIAGALYSRDWQSRNGQPRLPQLRPSSPTHCSDSDVLKSALAGIAGAGLMYYLVGRKDAQPVAAAGAEPGLASMTPTTSRSTQKGFYEQISKPVVIASESQEPLAQQLRKRLGCETYPDQGPTLSIEKFSSGDVNAKFNWQRVIGRRVVMIFDTVDQSRFFEQLAVLQALQGFAVPDAGDKVTKWKTYTDHGTYNWGRASSITIVMPWYRPCQMERTSRWQLDPATGKWTNTAPDGQWLDVPTAQYYARLLCTPGSVPPEPGPSGALDGMPVRPLWRPPLEILFIELHEEKPVANSVKDLNATIRMERYVPYFLDQYRRKKGYVGNAKQYVLFPDHGAFDRYSQSVSEELRLDPDHILFMDKARTGETITQSKTFYYYEKGVKKQKSSFDPEDGVLIIDDFTNSGSTLIGAVNLVKDNCPGGAPQVNIFVSHLVASYDPKVVEGLRKKIHGLGEKTKLFVTNSIPLTTNLLKDDPQVEVCDLSDFIAEKVLGK